MVSGKREIATLRLTGRDLSIADVLAVARRDVAVGLDRSAEREVDQAAKVVAEIARADDPVYGVNTGFGDLSTVRVPPDELRALQLNLVRSHAVGVGPELPEDVVRAVLLLRANTLAAGRSGVRTEVVDLLCDMLNRRVHPAIPRHGSVGASGDLAPLAHAALVLIGEGETVDQGRRRSGADGLKAAGLKPIELAPKEGVSLINGTQVMTAIGCLALHDAEVLATTADVVGAMSAEALRATDRAWDAELHATRPHPGQQTVAANLRLLMAGSPNVASHRVGDPRVQDPYSIRCMPQVHGASRDAIAYTRRVLEIEINAVTDNPIVFAEDHRVVSGGNFHGQPVAIALDLATIAVAELADISEARVDRMTNGHTSGLPPFLTRRPGTNSGFMVAQYTAAALVTENRLRAFPASVESLPTSAGMEDHVSMGVHAAHKLAEVVRNTRDVLAIEALCAAQGLDLLGATTAPGVEEARRVVRERSARLDDDRPLSGDITALADVIAREVLIAAVRLRLPELA
ncbi:MAG TPA: histidine ammonia-lyase [Candidatus Limnocylindria bacterium]|nr:histidine ammonia-lyase [Candidatus Limnocylindria bacterium]